MVHIDPVDYGKAFHAAMGAIGALAKHHGPLDRLRAMSAATAATERLLEALRSERDRQIGALGDSHKYGYQRIGRAAGMSASRASRIARSVGAKPRHVTDVSSTGTD